MYKINNTHWFNFSVFYGREQWDKLLNECRLFYSQNTDVLEHCLLFLSEERGEHIQILFSTKETEEKTAANFQKRIEKTFQEFVTQHPSSQSKPFPYGQMIWRYYDNNSIVWDRYDIKDFGAFFVDFAQKTSFLLAPLLQNDMSMDNVFSVCLYLCTKLTRFLKKSEIRQVVTACSEKMIKESDNFESYHLVSSLTPISPEKRDSIIRVIEKYYQDDSENSNEFFDWNSEAHRLFSLGDGVQDVFVCQTLSSIVCEHFGLSASHQLLIYQFIKEWASAQTQ